MYVKLVYKYYFYKTLSCVQWTVVQKPVSISLEQLVKFRYIRVKNGIDIMGKLHNILYKIILIKLFDLE
jgi:hypothetical protein